MKHLLIIILLAIAFAFRVNAQTVLYVDSTASGANNGISWANAYTRLSDAINYAMTNTGVDSILVAKGTYYPAGTAAGNAADKDIAFTIFRGGLKLYGGYPNGGGTRNVSANPVLLDGTNASHHVMVIAGINATADSIIVDGFTLKGGNANEFYFKTYNGQIVISYNGGGIYNGNNSLGHKLLIINCTISGNYASDGGGVYNYFSSPAIINCTISGNKAIDGGGVFNESSSPTIINCTISGNYANYAGGGVYNSYNSSPTIINCTISGNTAYYGGGGVYNIDNSSPTISNSIIYGNNTGVNNDNSSYTATYSLIQGDASTANGNLNGNTTDPLFVDAANPAGADGIIGTADDGLQLQFGSPCINTGNNGAVPSEITTDIVGDTRIINGTVDMGAYEYKGTVTPITLYKFTGSLQNGIATLQWQTGVESNFNHFQIEKSTDGKTFSSIGYIQPKGSGNSYSFNASQPEPVAYYRLKSIDNDGFSSVYPKIVVLSQTVNEDVVAYPNPAMDHINIKVANAAFLTIYDAAGRIVQTQALQAGINTIDVKMLPHGVYYGKLSGQTIKFIKE